MGTFEIHYTPNRRSMMKRSKAELVRRVNDQLVHLRDATAKMEKHNVVEMFFLLMEAQSRAVDILTRQHEAEELAKARKADREKMKTLKATDRLGTF